MNWKIEGKLMKKVLFATTALIATAGMAAAEITFSGGARFGVKYDSGSSAGTGTGDAAQIAAAQGDVDTAQIAADTANQAVTDNTADGSLSAADIALAAETNADLADAEAALAAIGGTAAVEDSLGITNRFTLNIDGSVETDSGIEFFARVRVRGGNTGDGDTGASGVSAPRVGLSVGGFTLATGNILGAYESAPGLYDGSVGLTGLGWGNLVGNLKSDTFAWDSFSSSGGGSNGVEVIYSNAGLGAHLSHSPTNGRTAAHVSYNFGDWTVAGAYQDGGDKEADSKWALHAGGSFGNFGVGLSYGDNDGTSKYRVNGSASIGTGTTVTAYVAQEDTDNVDTNFGLGFTQSLGGAVLAGGWARTASGNDLADLGVRFSF
jgi:outer membrane protein OmpU